LASDSVDSMLGIDLASGSVGYILEIGSVFDSDIHIADHMIVVE
jgi:hypothetical protein